MGQLVTCLGVTASPILTHSWEHSLSQDLLLATYPFHCPHHSTAPPGVLLEEKMDNWKQSQNMGNSEEFRKRNCLFFPPQSNHEKNIKQFPIEGHFAIYLTQYLSKLQGHQK